MRMDNSTIDFLLDINFQYSNNYRTSQFKYVGQIQFPSNLMIQQAIDGVVNHRKKVNVGQRGWIEGVSSVMYKAL